MNVVLVILVYIVVIEALTIWLLWSLKKEDREFHEDMQAIDNKEIKRLREEVRYWRDEMRGVAEKEEGSP